MEVVQLERRAYPHRTVGRCIVLAHADRRPGDEEFVELIAELHRVAEAEGTVRLLVYAAGDGAPNAKQRTWLRSLASLPVRVAVLSDSRAVRAIVTAISWVMKQPIQAFPSGDTSAIDFLELDAQEQLAVHKVLMQVCAECGVPRPKM